MLGMREALGGNDVMGSGRKGGSRCTTSSQNGSRRWAWHVSAHSTGFQSLLYNLSRLIRPHKPLSNPASSTTHTLIPHHDQHDHLCLSQRFQACHCTPLDLCAGRDAPLLLEHHAR